MHHYPSGLHIDTWLFCTAPQFAGGSSGFSKYRLPVFPRSWIMTLGAGKAIRTTQVPRRYTFFLFCFLSAGGVVCVHASRICVRVSEQRRLPHAWVCTRMPICASMCVLPCIPNPGSDAWSAAAAAADTLLSLTATPAVLRESERWRVEGGCNSPLTLQQKSLTVTAVVAHSRLLIHKDTGGAFTNTHTHTFSSSLMFILTLGPHFSAQDSPRACLPRPGLLTKHEKASRMENGWRAGGLGMEYAHSYKMKKCAVIHETTKDRDSVSEL